MATIALTDEQRRVLQSWNGTPVSMVDPTTQQRYVLLPEDQYEKVRSFFEVPAAAAVAEVPPGILRSQQAFWRDLPELLKSKRNHGMWVCYHGEERVGIARTKPELIRECVKRGLNDDEYDFDIIEHHDRPPWEPEEIEAGGHEFDEDEILDQVNGTEKPR